MYVCYEIWAGQNLLKDNYWNNRNLLKIAHVRDENICVRIICQWISWDKNELEIGLFI